MDKDIFALAIQGKNDNKINGVRMWFKTDMDLEFIKSVNDKYGKPKYI